MIKYFDPSFVFINIGTWLSFYKDVAGLSQLKIELLHTIWHTACAKTDNEMLRALFGFNKEK